MFSLISAVNEVVAVSLDCEGVGYGFVERTLPPRREGVGSVAKTSGLQAAASEVEKADLLPMK